MKTNPETIAILTQQKLEEIPCSCCGEPLGKCGGEKAYALMKAQCHPNAGLDVTYRAEDGIAILSCHECGQVIVAIGVMKSPPDPKVRLVGANANPAVTCLN